MKNSAGRGECYPPRPKAEVDNTLQVTIVVYLLSYHCGISAVTIVVYFE